LLIPASSLLALLYKTQCRFSWPPLSRIRSLPSLPFAFSLDAQPLPPRYPVSVFYPLATYSVSIGIAPGGVPRGYPFCPILSWLTFFFFLFTGFSACASSWSHRIDPLGTPLPPIMALSFFPLRHHREILAPPFISLHLRELLLLPFLMDELSPGNAPFLFAMARLFYSLRFFSLRERHFLLPFSGYDPLLHLRGKNGF